MTGNIINHETHLRAPRPELLTFETRNAEGARCLAAVATGLVPMSLQGRTHSFNHNVNVDIELPFTPASQVVSVSARGHELRGLSRLGFRRVGWSIVDYTSQAAEHGVRLTVSLWINNASAWSLGVIYNCTALSAALDSDKNSHELEPPYHHK